MAEFGKYAPLLKRLEGGFVNDPQDAGGATNAGVTLNTFRAYYGQGRTIEDLKNISNAQWSCIMKAGYWDKVHGDGIVSQGVAEMIADWAVNSGARTAVRGVQRILKVECDGKIGPITISAINNADSKSLFSLVKEERCRFYNAVVERNPAQKKFLKGWLNRLNEIEFK